MGDISHNTINLSDDSGSDETYVPSYDENKYLRTSQPSQFHTRARSYEQTHLKMKYSHRVRYSKKQKEYQVHNQKIKIKIKI